MLDSPSTRLRMRLTVAQTGPDPRTHYWYRAGKRDYRRLCDDTQWTWHRRSATFYDVCGRCRRMHQDDREFGRRAFSLTYRQTGVFGLGPEESGEQDIDVMRPVPMLTFAKFYAKDAADRERHFAERGEGGPSYYLQLEDHLRVRHWETNDIDQLACSDPSEALESHDMRTSRNQAKREHYWAVQESYAALWRSGNASYFRVDPVELCIGGGAGLRIEVDPEVGLRPRIWIPTGAFDDDTPWILKLCFDKEMPGPSALTALLYLLAEGRYMSGGRRRWDGLARLGVWDVRRSNIISVGLPDYIEDSIHEAADEYLALRERYSGS